MVGPTLFHKTLWDSDSDCDNYSDNDLVLFDLRWKETRLTDKNVSKYIVRGFSSSEVGSVLT